MGRPANENPEDAAPWWQAYQLAERGQEDELRRRAAGGDQYAARHLADWLAERGRPGEAVGVIRPVADAGDEDAARLLARWLAGQDAIAELRRRAAAGSYPALVELADWLVRHERLDELRELIAGRREMLAAWLAGQNDMAVLALAADLGDDDAQRRVDQWLARMRQRASAGNEEARQILAEWPG